jgi:hypothetical protein
VQSKVPKEDCDGFFLNPKWHTPLIKCISDIFKTLVNQISSCLKHNDRIRLYINVTHIKASDDCI